MDCQDGSRAGFWSIKRQVQVLDADYPVQKKPSPGTSNLSSNYFNLPVSIGGGVQPQKTQKTQNYLEIPFWVLGFLGFFGFFGF